MTIPMNDILLFGGLISGFIIGFTIHWMFTGPCIHDDEGARG